MGLLRKRTGDVLLNELRSQLLHFRLAGGEDKRGDGIGSQHRGRKSHEREVGHPGGTVHEGIVEEVIPRAADDQPPALLAQAITFGEGVALIIVSLDLQDGRALKRHDGLRLLGRHSVASGLLFAHI